MSTVRLKRPIRVEDGDGPPRYPAKEAFAIIRERIFKGDKHECSCCGKSFKLLLYSPIMASLCPYCLSIERYRLLCRDLRDKTDFGSEPLRVRANSFNSATSVLRRLK